MKFYTYIVYSETVDSFYIGMTSQLNERLRKHNLKSRGYSNRANDWVFVYQKEFEDKTAALKHEKEIKGWKSKTRIKQFLKEISTNE